MLCVNCYLKVWKILRVKDKNYLKAHVSNSTKQKDGSYKQEFDDYVTICGKAFNENLEGGDTFQVKKFGVSNSYDKDKKIKYYNIYINEIDNLKHKVNNEEFEASNDEEVPFEKTEQEE